MKHNNFVVFWIVNGFAALVPLEELREINFTKQYGIARDSEVIDILENASKTKGVFILILIVLFSYVYKKEKNDKFKRLVTMVTNMWILICWFLN